MHTALTQKSIDLYDRYVMKTYPKADILFTRGSGCRLWDGDGREYLDFAAGIAVCSLGHCHPAVTRAIAEQAGTLVHVSNLYMNQRQPELAEKLIRHGFDGVCFFCNSGAEANEGLIKLARKWGSSHGGKYEIIAMADSFHGRTLATLAATGRSKYRKGFEPDTLGFQHVPFNDLEALRNAVTEKTAAVLLEPVQGEGGIIPATQEYLEGVRKLCDEKGILLLFDEVQCGMGRTGTLFAWQNYGVMPDALSLAKALGNGYPIAAVVAQRKLENVLTCGRCVSTDRHVHASLRVIPGAYITGQAAGMAAALSLRRSCPPRALPGTDVRSALSAAHALPASAAPSENSGKESSPSC